MSSRPQPNDPLAVLADHLGRLLAQADKLLAEWKAHADGLKGRFDAEARAAGETLHKTLEGALADVAQASATQLERSLGANARALVEDVARARKVADELATRLGAVRPGGGSASGPVVPLLLLANALLVALLVVAFVRKPPVQKIVEPPPPPAPIVVATPDAGVPPKPPCSGIAASTGKQAIEECAKELHAEKELDTKKITCAAPPDGNVTVAWLLTCLPHSQK